MAVDRYLTVVRVRKSRPKPPIFTHSVCVVVWFISIAMVSPILHYTQIQGNEGQFMCIQKFPNDDPQIQPAAPVTSNPFSGGMDFGAIPTGNLPMPGFNLPKDLPTVNFNQLSLPNDTVTIDEKEGSLMRNRRDFPPIQFNSSASPVPALDLSGLNSLPTDDSDEKSDEIECKMADIFNLLKERVLHKCQTTKSKMLLQYLYSIFVLGFIIPLGVICYCYGRIMMKVKHTEKRAKRFVSKDIKDNPMWRAFTDTVTQPFVKYGMKKEAKIHLKMPMNKESTARRQLNRFVTLLLSTFVICRLPWYSWHLVKAHGFQIPLENCEIITDVTFCLAYMSSAINPLMYIFLGQDFRRRWNGCKSRIRAKLAKYSFPRWMGSKNRRSTKITRNSKGRTITSDLATRKSFLTKDVSSTYLKTKEDCVTVGASINASKRTSCGATPSNYICNDQCVNIVE
ncbi:Oidioi.mRNA.OKI2018_I69.chr1.g811.t1.cds [Oikopleura dioica]|uniref:Oidioi.mRNA.OKI2018_I69.chr1.g811.t1.cds n=1 Tax=Oikopleura dioica TaxID=34765 RepID=A0ABN7SPU4_OIKDI|nr:Oidioi.mRNA.OKI2018_I69.chr1.g811.t1.cds [Oikopleura dioica]